MRLVTLASDLPHSIQRSSYCVRIVNVTYCFEYCKNQRAFAIVLTWSLICLYLRLSRTRVDKNKRTWAFAASSCLFASRHWATHTTMCSWGRDVRLQHGSERVCHCLIVTALTIYWKLEFPMFSDSVKNTLQKAEVAYPDLRRSLSTWRHEVSRAPR
jgi:hypothetical protein